MSSDSRLRWRPMSAEDISAVSKLSSDIYLDLFETDIVLQEKLKLFPAGCHILKHGDALAGYLFSHPWHRHNPPPLNTRLGALPPNPDIYYIHDLALARCARGRGMAEPIVDETVKLARSLALDTLALVAVKDAEKFWERQKFGIISTAELTKKLETYGSGAYYMERAVF